MNGFSDWWRGVLSVFLVLIGMFFLMGDFRHFDQLVKQCTELGYVQDNKIRITCSVEAK